MEASLKNKTHNSFFARIGFIWRSISLQKKLYFLVGIMIVLIIFELVILSAAMSNLSAVRSLVGGEGMWSKGQKNAFYQFERYVLTKDPKDYFQIYDSLKIFEGDKLARKELIKKTSDLKLVREGFLQGKIDPEDMEKTIHFIKNFETFIYMRKALDNWSRGDVLLGEFKELAAEYRAEVLKGTLNRAKERTLLERIHSINAQLTVLEQNFSDVLGEGSRWMEKTILQALLAIVLSLSMLMIGVAFVMSRSITRRLNGLNKLAADYGQGNFNRQMKIDGKDEIGNLTCSINKMGRLLASSYREILESHQQLERKVQERTTELQTALALRDEFLSIANHELRTPLTAIVLQLRKMERAIGNCRDKFDHESARESLDKTNRLVKKLVKLQDVLLDLTQIQLGKFDIKAEDCDLAPIAADCVSQLSLEASRSGTSVKMSLPASVQGNFDPVRSSQVITNLLANAIKYGEGKPIEMNLAAEDGKAVLIVTDHGPGIPENKMNSIFDRFERGDHDNSLSGLGLGLYITRQIVEAHGGQIFVENVSGKGARFTAEFPL